MPKRGPDKRGAVTRATTSERDFQVAEEHATALIAMWSVLTDLQQNMAQHYARAQANLRTFEQHRATGNERVISRSKATGEITDETSIDDRIAVERMIAEQARVDLHDLNQRMAVCRLGRKSAAALFAKAVGCDVAVAMSLSASQIEAARKRLFQRSGLGPRASAVLSNDALITAVDSVALWLSALALERAEEAAALLTDAAWHLALCWSRLEPTPMNEERYRLKSSAGACKHELQRLHEAQVGQTKLRGGPKVEAYELVYLYLRPLLGLSSARGFEARYQKLVKSSPIERAGRRKPAPRQRART